MSKDGGHLRQAINDYYFKNETQVVNELLELAALDGNTVKNINKSAKSIINIFKGAKQNLKGIDSFLSEYDLSSEDGITLMCLAESLLKYRKEHTAKSIRASH